MPIGCFVVEGVVGEDVAVLVGSGDTDGFCVLGKFGDGVSVPIGPDVDVTGGVSGAGTSGDPVAGLDDFSGILGV